MSKDTDIGYIKLYRKVRRNYLWDERRIFSNFEAWLDLLFMANFFDNENSFNGVRIIIKRGELLTSQLSLSKRWNWNRERVRWFLRNLKKNNQVETQVITNRATKITICNYESYQGEQPTKQPRKQPTEQPHYKKEKNNIITAARSLITGSYGEKEFFSVLGKIKKDYGENALRKRIGHCISNGNEFENPGKLLAYFAACKNNNGVQKRVSELKEL